MSFRDIESCRNVLNIYFYLYWMREDFSEKEQTRFISSPNNMKCGLSRSARCLWWWLRPGWACPWHTPSAPSLIRTPYPLLLNLAQSLFLSFCRFVSSRFYFWHSSKKLVSLPILICQGIDDDGIMTTYCCGLLFYMYPPNPLPWTPRPLLMLLKEWFYLILKLD